ncbi:hypothetical protein Q5H92_15345 [Hymenobacter sp. M29]|uniref:DNA topoisomerase IV n=1 Tax=Hymenobacter mellowenesis TaxID=3063995 RepID=A0ABT9AE96_9BACT|nr:hypothetical protein [Hymenobacter sp. M29]MDO7847742.1 hypothetical protein [Hymenobacter sp. M29]
MGILLAVAFGLTACSTGPEKAVCQRFKTGHFQFRHHEPGFHFSSLIERTDSLQIERDEISGDISTLAVKWTGDCTYDLRLISSTKPFPDSIQHLRKTVPLHTEILGGTADYYLFKCYRDNSDLVITDTMWVRK